MCIRDSFTIDTLKEFKKRHKYNKLILLIGEDNLVGFNKWKDYKKIIVMSNYRKITPEEFSLLLKEGKEWQLLDVRESWEIEISRIPNSIFIPMDEVISRVNELDKEKPVAIICRSGIRSAKIAEALLVYPFIEIANIEGGINEWSKTLDNNIKEY